MEKEKGLGGEQNQNIWEKAVDEIDAAHKNEVYVNEVYAARNRFEKAREEDGENFLKEVNNVRTLIKTEVGPKDPIIKGPVEIAEGKKLILGITPDQKEAFAIVYRMDVDSKVSYYASVENIARESKEAKEVLIKYCDAMPSSVNHLIISEALAKKLQVKRNQSIKILSVHQKTSDINLDKI